MSLALAYRTPLTRSGDEHVPRRPSFWQLRPRRDAIERLAGFQSGNHLFRVEDHSNEVFTIGTAGKECVEILGPLKDVVLKLDPVRLPAVRDILHRLKPEERK